MANPVLFNPSCTDRERMGSIVEKFASESFSFSKCKGLNTITRHCKSSLCDNGIILSIIQRISSVSVAEVVTTWRVRSEVVARVPRQYYLPAWQQLVPTPKSKSRSGWFSVFRWKRICVNMLLLQKVEFNSEIVVISIGRFIRSLFHRVPNHDVIPQLLLSFAFIVK